MSQTGSLRILLVEDNAVNAKLTQIALLEDSNALQPEVIWVVSLKEALQQLTNSRFDVILLDLSLPDSDGLETVYATKRTADVTPIIILTGHDDIDFALEALDAGATDYMIKGEYGHKGLIRSIRYALQRVRMKAQNHLLMNAINAAPNGIVITDRDTRIEWANPAFSALTGYTLDEALGHRTAELVKSGVQDDAFYAAMWEELLVGQSWKGEIVNKRKDGSLYHEELIISPVQDESGKIIHFVAIKQDISERKRMDEAIRQSETKLRTLYESTYDAVMLLDEHGFFDCNRATLELFGIGTAEEFNSKHPADLSPPMQPCGTDSIALAQQKIARALSEGYQHFEWVHKRADTGVTFPADVLFSSMMLGGRQVLQAVVRDITAQKKAEEILLDARYRLENQVVNTQLELEEIKKESNEIAMALNVLLKQRAGLLSDAKNALSCEIEDTILPFLKRLKGMHSDRNQIRLIDILETNLQHLIKSYGHSATLPSAFQKLTPMEIQVASLVRQGFSSKHIAMTLKLSPATVDTHRKHIRKKLELEGTGSNLSSYLIGLDE